MRNRTENERLAIDSAYSKMAHDEALSSLQAEQIRLEGEQRCKDSAENAAIARETLEMMRDKAETDRAASRDR